MAFEADASSAQSTVLPQRHLTVAEMPPSVGERRFQRQQAGHGVPMAVAVDQAATQDHVSAALAVDRDAPRRRVDEAIDEGPVRGKRCAVELRIAAGQIDRVRVGAGAFAGQR